MTYQVLARKWRPQAFDAVVGQDAITRTLRNALISGRIAHAYLFAGPRGVGKTTTARLLARALLCPERTGAEPCGRCPVCVEAPGTLVDIVEIDAASNRGIDEIRALRENVKYAPSLGRYKVYIIDETHQLTSHAFDALLKTLEEPPPHVVFVLATTDPRDIPATVLSRVQRFDFRPIPPEVLGEALERILREEQIPFEPGALPVVVRAAEGSLRDALSLLDTAVAYGGGQLDAARVIELLGATTPAEVQGFTAALIGCDTVAALEAIDRAVRQGEDLLAFTRDVIELLRRILVLRAAPTARLTDVTPAEGNELRRLGESVSLDEILVALRGFLEADGLMRESPHPRVELEMATVRATRRAVPQAIDDILRRVDEAEARLRQQGGASPAAPASPVQESLIGGPAPAASVTPGAGSRTTAPAPRSPLAARPRPEAHSPGGPATGSEARGAAPTPATSTPRGPGAAAASPTSSSERAGAEIPVETAPEAGPGAPPASPAGSAPGSAPSRSPATRSRAQASRPSPSAAGAPEDVERAMPAPEAGGEGGEIATAWARILEEVMQKKPMLGAVLSQASPGRLEGAELTIRMGGHHFHRDLLADPASRDLLLGVVRRYLPGVERITSARGENGGGDVRSHPAVQAAIDVFQGEVVAVRPRPAGGGAQ